MSLTSLRIGFLPLVDAAQIYGQDKVEGVRLKDGREIPASLVVMAVGIRPNVKLAREAGLAIGRGTDALCKVETEQEALDYCAAFIQLYREEARYLDRTAPWVERVGMDYIKGRIVEDGAGREALRARFLFSHSFMQDDP